MLPDMPCYKTTNMLCRAYTKPVFLDNLIVQRTPAGSSLPDRFLLLQ